MDQSPGLLTPNPVLFLLPAGSLGGPAVSSGPTDQPVLSWLPPPVALTLPFLVSLVSPVFPLVEPFPFAGGDDQCLGHNACRLRADQDKED